jgi:hypothetical protein
MCRISWSCSHRGEIVREVLRADEADREILIDPRGDCPDPSQPCPWDLNGDGIVNGLDLVAVVEHYGPRPE